MTFVPVQKAAEQAERLLQILEEISAEPAVNHGVEAGVLSLWEILDGLAHPSDPNPPEVAARHVVGAGVHDLAAKISAVWDTRPQAREAIKPHLKLLAETYHIGQNVTNASWDRVDGKAREHSSANKVIELYWGCLCALAGMSIELDDPVNSSGGQNPDVIATASDGTTWAFAIKTLAQSGQAENIPMNLAANIQKGLDQILRSSADKGFVVINAKNIVNHEVLRQQGPYHTWMEIHQRLMRELALPLEPFYIGDVQLIKPKFEAKSKLAPVFVLVAHTTVLAYPPELNRSMFTEIKAMLAASLPTPDTHGSGSFGAEAVGLAEALNHVMQTTV